MNPTSIDWGETTTDLVSTKWHVKFRAGWDCAWCDRPCRMDHQTAEEFAAYVRMTRDDAVADEVRAHPEDYEMYVAHYPDPDPRNCAISNRIALCAPCCRKLGTRGYVHPQCNTRRPEQIALMSEAGR